MEAGLFLKFHTLGLFHQTNACGYVDIIIVLKDGVVVEQGTHDELLARNGLYADMWHQQEGEETNPI